MNFKRKVKKPSVARSMRLSPELDRELEKAARARGWSKSFLIRDILFGWLTFHKTKSKIIQADMSRRIPEGEGG
jgi:hypothetical protein